VVLSRGHQNAMAMIVGLVEDRVEVLDARRDADDHLTALGCCLGTRVQRRVVTVANFFDARTQLFALVEADEHHFTNLFALINFNEI